MITFTAGKTADRTQAINYRLTHAGLTRKIGKKMNFEAPPAKRPMRQTMFHFFVLVFILVFANWGAPAPDDTTSLWYYIFTYKWYITGILSLGLVYSLIAILKIK